MRPWTNTIWAFGIVSSKYNISLYLCEYFSSLWLEKRLTSSWSFSSSSSSTLSGRTLLGCTTLTSSVTLTISQSWWYRSGPGTSGVMIWFTYMKMVGEQIWREKGMVLLVYATARSWIIEIMPRAQRVSLLLLWLERSECYNSSNLTSEASWITVINILSVNLLM